MITVCRLWTVQYAWASHAPAAAAAGVSADVIAAIRDNRKPELKATTSASSTRCDRADADQGAQPRTYDRAIGQFGLEGTVDLISTVGYYAMVGIVLKGFDVPPPTGEPQLK